MRRRVGVVIGLDLDDPAADAVDQQRRADQFGRDLMDAAGEERALEACGDGMLADVAVRSPPVARRQHLRNIWIATPALAHPCRDLAIPFAEIEGRPKLL